MIAKHFHTYDLLKRNSGPPSLNLCGILANSMFSLDLPRSQKHINSVLETDQKNLHYSVGLSPDQWFSIPEAHWYLENL